VPKPLRAGPEFEATFPVRGRILEAVLCADCEEEGYLRIRLARDPEKGWTYDPKDPATFVDVFGLDPHGSYGKVRAGEWTEGRVVCFGYLKRVRSRGSGRLPSLIENGTRLVGRAHVDEGVTIDFGLFKARLAFESEEVRRKVLKDAKIRDGTYLATDVGIDIELKRWGTRESVLRR